MLKFDRHHLTPIFMHGVCRPNQVSIVTVDQSHDASDWHDRYVSIKLILCPKGVDYVIF